MPRGRLASRTATCIAALVCVLVHSTQAAPTGNVTDDPRPGAAAAPAAPLPPAYGAARAPPVTPRAGSTAGGGAAHFNMSYLRPQRSAGAPRNRTREAELRRLADAWRLTAKQAAALGVANAEGKIRICISHFPPNVMCDDLAPEHYSGYQVELFRLVAQDLYWLGDARTGWFFDCISWDELLRDMSDPNGTCMLMPSGVNADGAHRISWVIDKEGLKILIRRSPSAPLHLFSPFEALSWSVWLALAATAVFVGATAWFCDMASRALARPQPPPPRREGPAREPRGGVAAAGAGAAGKGDEEYKPPHIVLNFEGRPVNVGSGGGGRSGKWEAGASDAGGGSGKWQSGVSEAAAGGGEGGGGGEGVGGEEARRGRAGGWLLRCIGVDSGEERDACHRLDENLRTALLKFADVGDGPSGTSLPAQIVLFTYGILIILVIAFYTAGVAARLTSLQMNGVINGREDLPGKVVGTWEGYVPRLQALGIRARGYPWMSGGNEAKMLQALQSGAIEALILDANTIDYMAANNCDVMAVGMPFSIMDGGIGLAPLFPAALEADLNGVIRDDIHDGMIEKLHDIHVMRLADASRCQSAAAGGPDSTIYLEQVAGLWVMLGIGVVSASFVLGLMWFHRRHRHVARLVTKMPAGVRSVSGRVFTARRSRSGAPPAAAGMQHPGSR